MRLSAKALGVVLALASRASAQSSKECSRDPTVVGYESIAALNNDMETELNRIRDGGTPEESYTYRLCPNQLFDAEASPLLPVLNNAMFVCGSDGSRANNCIIIGGSEQVRIENSQVETYPLESLTFIGLTFADFKGNDAITGTSIAALASAPTTATFMDVTFTDFNSDFVVRQTTGFSPDAPMTVDIEDSIVVSGTSGVLFDNDGGQLIVQNVQVSSVSTAAIVATANAGTSFLQESTISASDIDSVTFTTAMGTQTVMNVEVNAMNSLGDVFYAEGDGSMLVVTGSVVSQNNIVPPPAWNGVVAQSGASATVMDTTIRDNTGIEFGVSATLGSTVVIKNSMISGNTGVISLNTTTTPVFAISDSAITLEMTEINNNGQFSAAALALLRSSLSLVRSCFQDSFSEFVVFVDSSSTYNADMNFIDGYQSDQCPLDARLFKESEGSGCFLGGGVCEGMCETLADQEACLARVGPTEAPSMMSNMTVAPSIDFNMTAAPTTDTNMTAAPSFDTNMTAAPSFDTNMTTAPSVMGNVTTLAPSVSPAPSVPITEVPTMPPGMPTGAPTATPTTKPTTATPTETPSMTLEPTRSPAPSAVPTISTAPTTSPAPTTMASETPSSVPTADPTTRPPVEGGPPTPCPKEESKKRSSKSGKKPESSKSSKSSRSSSKSSSKSGKGKRKRGMRKRNPKPSKDDGKGQSGKGGKYDRSATIVPSTSPDESGVRDLFRSWRSLLQLPETEHQAS